jgi:formylglycine-generating enzyme required for sulfatase activity
VSTGAVQNTGANAGCVSDWGANDMVGNLDEWVADWDELAAGCAHWPGSEFGGDWSCVGSAEGDPSSLRLPAALIRGGHYFAFVNGPGSGPFAVSASLSPDNTPVWLGFRGAR